MKLKAVCALVIAVQSFGALATPVSLTSKVKSVSLVGRPGVDYGGVQILLDAPITGTACAPADVARGFYYSSGTAASGAIVLQAYMNLALSAQAQDIPMTINYDTATACVSGYGVGMPATPVTLPTPPVTP